MPKGRPAAAAAMHTTNYSIGADDSREWRTTKDVDHAPPGIARLPAAKQPHKNASDSAAIFGEGHGASRGAAHFTTANAVAFDATRTGVRPGYERTKPPPGFDRATANKTNYSLSLPGARDAYTTQNGDNARRLREPVRGPGFKPRKDVPGKFDIITGHPARPTRVPAGPKPTSDKAFKSATKTAAYNIVSGTMVKRAVAPPPSARRGPVDVPVLGSGGTLRPETSSGTRYYN